MSENTQLYLIENKHYKTLNVFSLGREVCEPRHSCSIAYVDYYLIHYVISGSGQFVKNGVVRSMAPGELFVIKPGSTYYYEADEKNPWEYAWVGFDGDIAQVFDTAPDVMTVEQEVFLSMFEAERYENMRLEYLTGKLYGLIAELFESKAPRYDYVRRVSDFVKANYMRKFHIKDIAESMNLNSRYLSRIFKERKGVSLQDYVLDYKMKKARELLQHGLSVGEVAHMVGYEDLFTFSKAFKKKIGVSPSQIKAEIQNEE